MKVMNLLPNGEGVGRPQVAPEHRDRANLPQEGEVASRELMRMGLLPSKPVFLASTITDSQSNLPNAIFNRAATTKGFITSSSRYKVSIPKGHPGISGQLPRVTLLLQGYGESNTKSGCYGALGADPDGLTWWAQRL